MMASRLVGHRQIPDALRMRATQALRPPLGVDQGQRTQTGTSPVTGEDGIVDDPVRVSGQAVAETQETGARQEISAAIQREVAEAQEVANAQFNSDPGENGLFPASVQPPDDLAVPFFAQLTWANIPDLDLHATGPNPGDVGRRYHVFFAQPTGPSDIGGTPVAELDQDVTGIGASEVITFNSPPSDGPTRLSVFNFGDAAPGSDSLANESDAVVSLFRNGSIQ